MNDFCCSFQSANGINPETIINISSNNNFLFSSNINFALSNNIYLGSNDNFQYSSSLGDYTRNEIDSLKNKDLSHDFSISTINLTLGSIQGEIAVHTTAIAGNTGAIALHSGAIAVNNAAIADLSLNKLNKSSLTGVSVIYKDAVDNVQLSYNSSHFKETSLVSGNTRLFNLADNYSVLPTTVDNNSNSLFTYAYNSSNSLFTNSFNNSNSLFNYSYNNSNSLFTNSFNNSNSLFTYSYNNSNSLSNLNSNTSNSLFNYSSNNSYSLNNLINNTSNSLFTYSFNSSNILNSYTFNTSNNCINYANSSFLTPLNASNTFYTKTEMNNSITTKKLQVGSDYYGYADRVFNVSSNIYIRNEAPTTNFNDMNMVIGVGDATVGTLIPSLNLNMPSNAAGFNGIKLLRNGLLHLCSPNSMVISSVLNNVEIHANKIYLVGEVSSPTGTIAKKIPKFFTTSRTANFDGVSCLAYDIDLTKVSAKQTIDTIDFRHFRIKFFFANGRLDYQWSPRTFEISMSSYNSLSVSCNDNWGVSSGLNKAFSSEYFLYKQNIDLITFCCPTAIFGTTNLKVCYFIEDLISQ